MAETLLARLLARNLEDEVMAKLQKRAKRHGRSPEEEGRDILRNVLNDERGSRPGLGTKIAARFRGKGLTQGIPEQRGQPARPAEFD